MSKGFLLGCIAVSVVLILLVRYAPSVATETDYWFSRHPLRFIYTYRGGRVESALTDCAREGCEPQETLRVYVPIYQFIRDGLENGQYKVTIYIYPPTPRASEPGQEAKVYVNGELVSTLRFDRKTADGDYALGSLYVQPDPTDIGQLARHRVTLPCPADLVREDNVIAVERTPSVQWDLVVGAMLITAIEAADPWWTGHMPAVFLIAALASLLFLLFIIVWRKSIR